MILIVVLASLVGGDAMAAEPVDADALAQCLMTNSGDNETATLKKVMIAALTDDQATLKSSMSEFGNLIVDLALKKCGISASQFADPNFQAGGQKYGVLIGTKIMQDAFAKMK